MAELTETDRAIAEGARVSQTPEQENLLAEFRAIQAELGGPEDEESEAAELSQQKPIEKTTPAKGKDGRFLAKDKTQPEPEKKKGTEGRTSVQERIELREERRRLKADLGSKEAAVRAKWGELQNREAALAHIAKARELFEAGDYDGAALAAFGIKTWNELNDQAARAFASPEYKRVKALEEKDRQREAERAKEKAEAAEARRQAEETRILSTFRAGLDETLPKADDETIAALAATDPKFVDAVFRTVVAAARQGEDLDPIEVAQEIAEEARSHYERIHKIFGGRPASMAEALSKSATPDRAGSKKQPAKPHTHVSRSSAIEASAPPEFENDAEWIAFGAKALKRAQLEDDAAGMSVHNWG